MFQHCVLYVERHQDLQPWWNLKNAIDGNYKLKDLNGKGRAGIIENQLLFDTFMEENLLIWDTYNYHAYDNLKSYKTTIYSRIVIKMT